MESSLTLCLKTLLSGMGYLFFELMANRVTLHSTANTLDYPPELDRKTLLLNTTQT